MHEHLIVNIQPEINAINVTFCKWLDFFMYYQVMWSNKTPKNENRNLLINTIGIAMSIGFMLLWIYFTVQDYQPNETLPFIITSISLACGAIARMISLYYLLYFFNYPWHEFTLKYDHSDYRQYLELYLNKNIKQLNSRLKWYSIICYAMFIIHIGSYMRGAKQNIFNWLDVTVSFFGYYIPPCLFQAIWSVIALKYQLRLYYLQMLFNDDKPNFVLVLKEYKTFYIQFQNDYKIWIYYMMILSLWICSNLWNYANVLFYRSLKNDSFSEQHWLLWVFLGTGAIGFAAPLFEFSTSSSKLNMEYNKLVHILWQYDNFDNQIQKTNSMKTGDDIEEKKLELSLESQHLLDNAINCKKINLEEISLIVFNIKDFHFLLHYLPKYPLLVKLWSIELTTYTPMKFIVAFGVAKFISYSLYYFY
eukprot:195523_1